MRKIKSSKTLKNFHSTNIQDCFFTIVIFLIMLIIVSNPKKFTSGTISGLNLFFYSVLPGLFPFMLLTKLLTEIGFLFKVTSKFNKQTSQIFGTSGVSLYVFLMSILSGYPIGAKIISDLFASNQITQTEARKMSVFCTTSGPIFVVGAVGTAMFGSMKIGLILYFSHIISSLLLGIVYNLLNKEKTLFKSIDLLLLNQNKTNIISTVVSNTINSLFVVGAYITIFYLLTEILESFKVFSFLTNLTSPALQKIGISKNSVNGFFYGLLEVTRGCKVLSENISASSVALCSGILSFSGCSIIMQSMAFLKTAKIKARNFVFSKCVHALFSMLLCFLLIIIFGCWVFDVVYCFFKLITISFNNCKVLV